MVDRAILCGLLICGIATLHAEEPSACSRLLSAQDVLDCALKNHPAIQRAAAAQAQARSLEAVALQRPNPDLEVRNLSGRFQGENLGKTEAALLHTFELGGKRGSRAERALAEQRVSAAILLKAQEDVALDTVLALYRLRQARDEDAILEKTLSSLAAITAQLRSRPRLTPEQEASLDLFQLAAGENNLKKSSLEGEARALTRSLELAISTTLPSDISVLPELKSSWPQFPDAAGSFSGSEASRSQAELQSAHAELSAANASAFPDLRAGPAIERDVEGSSIRQSYGVSLGLPLPLYQRNKAGKEFAKLGVKKAEENAAFTQSSLQAQRQAELARYRAAVQGLQQVATVEETDAKLRRINELSGRGLITSSLIIETYRQIFELTRSRHEAELAAVRSLWRMYAIEGRILSEKL